VSSRVTGLEWRFEPPSSGTADTNGLVSISLFPSDGSATGNVRAQYKGVSGETKVTIWASADAATSAGDVVEFPHRPGMPPSVVLLEESGTGKCAWGVPRAFVGAAAVGEQRQAPCSLALLSGSHRMLFSGPIDSLLNRAWRPAGAKLTFNSREPVILSLSVFIGVTGRTASPLSGLGLPANQERISGVMKAATEAAAADVAWANVVYEANRTGITFEAKYRPLPVATNLAGKLAAATDDCQVPRELPAKSTQENFAYDAAAVSVYYMDWIDLPEDPFHPGARGLHCKYWGAGELGPAILISYNHHSPITLAHELGHALGLCDEDHDGNCPHDEVWLGPLNVMSNLLPDGPLANDARSQFTVGQVFRMNVWDNSWINAREERRHRRACTAAEPCPPVDFDVR
jgi:hypothetical protein